MSKKIKKTIEATLHRENGIRGKGEILAFVWSQATAFPGDRNCGMAVRQTQLGNMDAVHFQVSSDYKTVRFLGKDRLVLNI